MAKTLWKARIKHRTDSTANWNSKNPILFNGEWGVERSTTGIKFKVGDGQSHWKDLAYLQISLDNAALTYFEEIKTTATSSVTLAANSATNAKNSATAAANSATSANNSKVAAATSEANAKSSETKAKTSETNAKTSETNAKASETKAKTSETNAKTSETNAKSSETNAASSETNAEQANTSAQQALLDIQTLYQGIQSVLPASVIDSFWDSTKTYQPGDCVITNDGSSYRCIKTSTGNPPVTSPEYWASISISITETFEYDSNGDIMPKIVPVASQMFDIDDNGDIIPTF